MVSRALRGYVILVTVFMLGAVLGGTSVFAVFKHRYTAQWLDDRVDERRLDAMSARLALDAVQRERIAAILNEARREAKRISLQTDARCGHPLIDHRAKVDERIRAELRAPQQARFDELLARRREIEAAPAEPSGP
jgi:hypothetical protein